MKRFFTWLLIACVAVGVVPLQAAAATEANIVIDGDTLQVEEGLHAYVEGGTTYAPFRSFLEKLGLDVDWEDDTRTAIATNDDVSMRLQPDAQTVTINDEETISDVPMNIVQNRLFVPVRFLAEKMDLDVSWEQSSRTVTIESPVVDEDETDVEDTEAFLKELIAANEKLNSYSAAFDIEQMMSFDGEEIAMDMTMSMDVVMDPLGIYQHIKMSMAELDEEEMTSESYITEDGFFTYESMFEKWVKYDDDMYEELLGLSDMQTDPVAQFEMMKAFIDEIEVYENEDTYDMHISVSGEGFQELLDLLLGIEDFNIDEMLDEMAMNFEINEMTIITTVDKETLFPLKDEMSTDMTIAVEDEEVRIVQTATSSYSAHNELESITVPQSVIDEAISFEEYIELIESEMDFDFDFDEDELDIEFETTDEEDVNEVELEEAS